MRLYILYVRDSVSVLPPTHSERFCLHAQWCCRRHSDETSVLILYCWFPIIIIVALVCCFIACCIRFHYGDILNRCSDAVMLRVRTGVCYQAIIFAVNALWMLCIHLSVCFGYVSICIRAFSHVTLTLPSAHSYVTVKV